jgi:molybdenum cofactor biosynthesis enzyme MoaA
MPEKKTPQCFAPLSNLLIDQEGRMMVCCMNHHLIIGRYPGESIQTIWFGEKRNNIVKQFQRGDISDGCQQCIESNQPGSNLELCKQYSNASFTDLPKTIELALDDICNLSCIMCSSGISSGVAQKSENDLVRNKVTFDDRFIDELKPFIDQAEKLLFSGGEPFLTEIYFKIWNYIIKKNLKCKLNVQTNGTILNERIKTTLTKLPFEIGISLDAVTPALYEQIRVGASFKILESNIKYYEQYTLRNHSHLSVIATPIILNRFEIPGIVEFCNKNAYHLHFSILERPYQVAIWSLNSAEIEKILNFYIDHRKSGQAKTKTAIQNLDVYDSFINLIAKYCQQKKSNEQYANKFKQEILQTYQVAQNDLMNKLNTIKLANTSLNIKSNNAFDLLSFFVSKFNPEEAQLLYIKLNRVRISDIIDVLSHSNEDQIINICRKEIENALFLISSNSYDRLNFINN